MTKININKSLRIKTEKNKMKYLKWYKMSYDDNLFNSKANLISYDLSDSFDPYNPPYGLFPDLYLTY
jgi:hypothetical protein